jgi:DNA-binding transcriptional LysR family regulator
MVLPEIRLLQAAIVLAEELNFTRAADRLNIEQSTLSKRIRELEEQIDLKLFQRTHQAVELTEAGRHFVEDARSSVLHAERAVHGARAAQNDTDVLLNVGRSQYIDPYLLTALQSIRLPMFPNLRIKLCSHFSHELVRMVAAGSLDMALVIAIPDTQKLTFQTVAEAPLYIALPKGEAVTHRAELRLEDIRGCDWIMPAHHINPYFFQRVQAVMAAKGIVPPDVHYIVAAEEASALVLAHNGAAFLTRENAWRISCNEIAIRPLAEDGLKLVTRLVARADNKTNLVSEYVRATARKLEKIRLPLKTALPSG